MSNKEYSQPVDLESDFLKVEIQPEIGGKIRSLVSKRTGKEFLYQDPRKERTETDYIHHDISGYDECFPTILECPYPGGERGGLTLADHGFLWQIPWKVVGLRNSVEMFADIPELECRFQRNCYFEKANTLRLDYSIKNEGKMPLKYLYSAHPILAAGESSKLIYPKEMNRVYVFFSRNVPNVTEGTWLDYPTEGRKMFDADLSTNNESIIKVYTNRLEEGSASVFHPDVNETLTFEFDTSILSHLGILVMQGFGADEKDPIKNDILFALEPCSGVGDGLEQCVETDTLREIPPGQEVQFWIQMTLEESASE